MDLHSDNIITTTTTIDKVTGSGLSQTVLFSDVFFPLVVFVNNLLRPIDPINQNVQRWLRMDHTPGAAN